MKKELQERLAKAGVKGKSGMHDSNCIPVSLFRAAPLDNYVCGYVQSFIAREKDLAAIKEKWPLVL